MSNAATITQDFAQLMESPTAAYEEGLRFFRGTGLMNETLRRLAKELEERRIDYAVIGAVALNQYGYRRFTEDIDLLLTGDGLERFRQELVGRGYRPAFEGAKKKFRATAENVPIEIRVSGDGKSKSVVFPEPAVVAVTIDGVRTVSLEKLVELKLASGITGLGRRKDIADVQELIRVRGLDAAFSEALDPSVRELFLELHREVEMARSEEQDADEQTETE